MGFLNWEISLLSKKVESFHMKFSAAALSHNSLPSNLKKKKIGKLLKLSPDSIAVGWFYSCSPTPGLSNGTRVALSPAQKTMFHKIIQIK